MEQYQQRESIDVFGVCVTTFPQGIEEAFTGLVKTFGNNRAYYGISWFDEAGSIQYYAMAAAAYKDELAQYSYTKLTIEAGTYFTKTLPDWKSKTDQVKDMFRELMGARSPDKNHPCIEWYKNDKEMVCMVKAYA